MSVDEIFAELSAHMEKGLLVHDQLSSAFKFLNLDGYCKCHKYHYFEESYNYKKLKDYYIKYFNKLLPFVTIETPNFIPSTWFKYTRSAVDASTIRNGIRDLMRVWVDWETEAKTLFEKSYTDLLGLGEVCAAQFVGIFASETNAELAGAREKWMNLEASGYDMTLILEEQNTLEQYYHTQIKEIFNDD